MKKYQPREQETLAQVVENRKKIYLGILQMTTDTVYNSGDLKLMSGYEQVITNVAHDYTGSKGLEPLLGSPGGPKRPIKTAISSPGEEPENKGELTYKLYKRERRLGKSHQDIEKTYCFNSPKT